jgi:hypothetical protein
MMLVDITLQPNNHFFIIVKHIYPRQKRVHNSLNLYKILKVNKLYHKIKLCTHF